MGASCACAATGSKTTEYNVCLEGDPNAGIEQELARVASAGNASAAAAAAAATSSGSAGQDSASAGGGVTVGETELQFQVKWRGWSHLHNTWETIGSLEEAGAAGIKKLENFMKRLELITEWSHYPHLFYYSTLPSLLP